MSPYREQARAPEAVEHPSGTYRILVLREDGRRYILGYGRVMWVARLRAWWHLQFYPWAEALIQVCP